MSNQNALGQDSWQDITRHIIDACIQWGRMRGYRDSVGILFGLTMVAEEPVSLDELVAETGYSKSTVSSNMNLLENLKFVKRIVVPGDKRHLYMPVTDPKAIQDNMLDFIEKELHLFIGALNRTEEAISSSGAEMRFLRERIDSLRLCYDQGEKILDLLRKQSGSETC